MRFAWYVGVRVLFGPTCLLGFLRFKFEMQRAACQQGLMHLRTCGELRGACATAGRSRANPKGSSTPKHNCVPSDGAGCSSSLRRQAVASKIRQRQRETWWIAGRSLQSLPAPIHPEAVTTRLLSLKRCSIIFLSSPNSRSGFTVCLNEESNFRLGQIRIELVWLDCQTSPTAHPRNVSREAAHIDDSLHAGQIVEE